MNGIFIEEKLRILKQRETTKNELLDWEEAKWKQKNRTWISQGDEKLYFFHTCDKMRKTYNHCMSIKDEEGNMSIVSRIWWRWESTISKIFSRNALELILQR